MATIDQLEEQRRKALERLESLRTYYERPDAAQLLAQFQGRASGEQQPFDRPTLDAMYSQNADASAGMFAGERDAIRQQFANAGLGGSGLETSALITSRRRAGAAARAGRRDITSRAALENYQARERAQQQVAQYLRDRQQAEQTAGLAEVDFRSQMREVTDGSGPAAGTGSPTSGGFNAAANNNVRAAGIGTSYRGYMQGNMGDSFGVNPSASGARLANNYMSQQPPQPQWAPSVEEAYAPNTASYVNTEGRFPGTYIRDPRR
jgi:hypothetical protein